MALFAHEPSISELSDPCNAEHKAAEHNCGDQGLEQRMSSHQTVHNASSGDHAKDQQRIFELGSHRRPDNAINTRYNNDY
jgi:hypothetical protein